MPHLFYSPGSITVEVKVLRAGKLESHGTILLEKGELHIDPPDSHLLKKIIDEVIPVPHKLQHSKHDEFISAHSNPARFLEILPYESSSYVRFEFKKHD